MISFGYSDSPFFLANKQYCDNLVSSLASLASEFTGECTSYGYRVKTQFKKGGLSYDILFIKFQTTQNGVVIPKEANEYAGTQFKISGLLNTFDLRIGKSRLKRIFTPKEYKALLPAPFYVSGKHLNQYSLHSSLAPFVLEQGIDEVKVKGGKALLKMHKPMRDPLEVIERLEKVFGGFS